MLHLMQAMVDLWNSQKTPSKIFGTSCHPKLYFVMITMLATIMHYIILLRLSL